MRCLLLTHLLLTPVLLGAQQRRHCQPLRSPDPLPMAMQLVDSAALAAALPPERLPPTTFSLWYDSSGTLTHALALPDSLIAQRLAAPDSQSLARAVLGTVIARAAFPQDSGSEMIVRLTMSRDSAGGLVLAVGRSIWCSPVAKQGPRPPNDRRSVSWDDVTEFGRATTATVSFVVDTAGHPLEIIVVQSSGTRLIDANMVESIESATYEPGRMDGFPKKVTLRVTAVPLHRP